MKQSDFVRSCQSRTTQNSQKVDDRNIAQMAAVADWILFGQRTDGQWSDEKVEWLTNLLHPGGNLLPPEARRKLNLARQLNDILKRNEEVSIYRNDAQAFAEGMRVLFKANTHKGKVNEKQLMEDMTFFMIDQNYNLVGIPAKYLHDFKPSNAAYNLFGGPRVGTVGWKEKYWDQGRQYDENGVPINQAHHFAAFFIVGLENPGLAKMEAIVLDGMNNPEDVELSNVAIDLAKEIRRKETSWENIPSGIYQKLKR